MLSGGSSVVEQGCEKGAGATSNDEDLPYKFWLPLSKSSTSEGASGAREARGELLVSVQMVPEQLVARLEAGNGRSEPNANPKLPPPSGRLKFSLNPAVLLYRLLGPKLCARFTSLLCALVGVLLLYYMLPVVLADLLEAVLRAPFAALFG